MMKKSKNWENNNLNLELNLEFDAEKKQNKLLKDVSKFTFLRVF